MAGRQWNYGEPEPECFHQGGLEISEIFKPQNWFTRRGVYTYVDIHTHKARTIWYVRLLLQIAIFVWLSFFLIFYFFLECKPWSCSRGGDVLLQCGMCRINFEVALPVPELPGVAGTSFLGTGDFIDFRLQTRKRGKFQYLLHIFLGHLATGGSKVAWSRRVSA